jgi:rhamnogalacturonyl hydrolase YesR
VDDRVFGIVPFEIAMHGGPKGLEYLFLGKGLADKQWATTTNDGISTEARYWVDDMYMITALQVQAFRATRDARYLDRAALATAAYLDRLQQPNGLFVHTATSPRYWGRGNGWFAAGMTELLRALPPTHPRYARIMAGYQKMMAALLRTQTASGMWRQLVDDNSPHNWPETSSTGMFAFAMVTGVKNGWLSADTYGPAARKAWLALVQYLDADGNVRDVCPGTGEAATSGGGTSAATQIQYYLDRPRIVGDFHGQAPLLWTASALMR